MGIVLMGFMNAADGAADPQSNPGKRAPMSQASSSRQKRTVIVNRLPLSDEQMTALEQSYQTPIQDGAYWYDRVSGAWGIEGGPVAGFVVAGINVGGDLRPDASHGNTNVFINGRELHIQDVRALQQLGPVLPGRYWVMLTGIVGLKEDRSSSTLCSLRKAAVGFTITGTR